MPPPKKKVQKQKHKAVVYDDLCYMSDREKVPARCAPPRLHYFTHSYNPNVNYAAEFYSYLYKKAKLGMITLDEPTSLEELLRTLHKDLVKKENAGKMIGDLIILTHGIEVYDADTGNVETVKIALELMSSNDPNGQSRSIPLWTRPPGETMGSTRVFDAEDVDLLIQPGSEYYKYVNSKGDSTDLITGVTKEITDRMDGETHIWLSGCNLGKNKDLLKSIRKLFKDKPVIYAFTMRHFISYYWSGSTDNCTSHSEVLRKKGQKKGGIGVWTEAGMKEIAHEP